MTDEAAILALSDQRVQEAKVLLAAGLCDGAFYLIGYSVELALKAKICNRLGIPNLFDPGNSDKPTLTKLQWNEFRKPFLTHDLLALLAYSGLKAPYDSEKAANQTFFKLNSFLFTAWDESVRYKPCGHTNLADVKGLVDMISQPQGLLEWIKTN
ncbi:MAG: hypothetical protein ABIV51_12880 [Saprospiraceae bacterium]